MTDVLESFDYKIILLDDFVKWILEYMNDEYYFLGNHSKNVAIISCAILDKLGINGQDKKLMQYGALLHDIGKLSIPKDILLAPRRLSDKEFEIIKDHPIIGFNKLSHIKSFVDINLLVLYHHYRNGLGYPEDLIIQNTSKPNMLLVDILTVADAYSAIQEKRMYNNKEKEVFENISIIKMLKDEKEIKNQGINQEIVDVLSSCYKYIR